MQLNLARREPCPFYRSMLRPSAPRLWLRLAWPLLLFVATGSLALAVWLHTSARHESRVGFIRLAQTNADFIRSARLPTNERVAASISRVLNMQVFFRHESWDVAPGESGEMRFNKGLELVPLPQPPLEKAPRLGSLEPGEGIVRVTPRFEALAVPVEKDVSLILVRAAEPAFSFLLRPQTLLVLGAFWLLSVALAWALTRGLVRPLRLIAERLPHIEDDSERYLPGAERHDEIGQLARAYLHTRAQLALERAQREKAERLALLGRMASGLAHEIHNPLSAIRMHAQLIDSSADAELAGAARDSLPVLLAEAAKIEGLVNQWMFLARPAPPQTAAADLAELVAQVVRTHSLQAAHAGVRITTEIAEDLRVKVDARRIAQAIGNVVLNAIQAMPAGGVVKIAGWRADALHLSFRDKGPGFSAKALAHHAELFFSEKEGGMGIGLSVTSEILRAHDGALSVANAPDGGAIVTFILPPLPA